MAAGKRGSVRHADYSDQTGKRVRKSFEKKRTQSVVLAKPACRCLLDAKVSKNEKSRSVAAVKAADFTGCPRDDSNSRHRDREVCFTRRKALPEPN